MAQLDAVERIFEELSNEPGGPSIAALEQRGLDPSLLARVLIIEFGNDDSAYLALAPARYIHQGRELLAHEVDLTLY